MCSNHRNSDYIQDVNMEIRSSFFPPPNVLIPTSDIPPLRNFVYNFKTEKEMVQRYENERRRKDEAEEELKHNITQKSHELPGTSSSDSLGMASDLVTTTFLKSGAMKPILLLSPKPIRSTPQNSTNVTLPKKAEAMTSSAPKLHGFEEFESTATVFDLMELRSLDDRKELEKLLL